MTEQINSKKSNKKLILICSAVVVVMFSWGYALVPLYNVMCKTLGINGKTGGPTALSNGAIDNSRTVMIQFMSVRNAQIPWDFRPKQRTVRVHPGENKRIAYFAKNLTDETMTVQAIPSISPGIAAKHLKKTECFCFTQQTMPAHQGMDWPILFHIDKDLPKNIHTITLAYTLFDLTHSPIKKKAGDHKQGRLST